MINAASKMLCAGGWSPLKIASCANFGIQFAGFTVANYFKTEKFYDLVGSVTNILVPSVCFFMSRNKTSTICKIQYACAVAWAARLGGFLFYRVMRDGGDRRFDKIKSSSTTFFTVWMVQGVWVSLITLPSCCLFLYQNTIGKKPSIAHMVGWGLFATGFLIEAIADHQKLTFKGKPGKCEDIPASSELNPDICYN